LNFLLFFLFEKETLFPVIAFLPVKSQTRDISYFLFWVVPKWFAKLSQ